MHHSVSVTERECLEQLFHEPLGPRLGDATAAVDLGVVEREEVDFHARHDEKEAVVRVRAHFEQLDDVLVLESQ